MTRTTAADGHPLCVMAILARLRWLLSTCMCACRVCVVYGALPPEMRRTQALLFNDPDSGYDVLVASDAVGMGLNLNIRRIIFHTMSKFQDGVRVPISISQIKQIGGAAFPPTALPCTWHAWCIFASTSYSTP